MNENNSSSLIHYGKEARSLFKLDPNYTFVNHGSYGVTPTQLLEKRIQLIEQQESVPDKWFRYDAFDMWTQSLASLAKFLHVDDVRHLVLCFSLTEAANSVIKSIKFNQNMDNDPTEEVILAGQYTFISVLNTLNYVSKNQSNKQQPIKIFYVPVTYPVTSAQQIIDEYDKMCKFLINEKGYRIRFAWLDHIASKTATLFPIKEIIQTIRKWSKDTLIMVDGAHAIGQIEIKLDEYDCDFYCSNLHKWFLSSRGCSFLYIRDLDWAIKHLEPTVLSNEFGNSLSEKFYDRATCDMSPLLLIDDYINFHVNMLGGLQRIRKYNVTLVEEAANMLAKSWQTSLLGLANECQAPYMRHIQLPVLNNYKPGDENVCHKLLKRLLYDYKVDTFIALIQNTLYCRIGCYIYNELDDYVILKNAILDLSKN